MFRSILCTNKISSLPRLVVQFSGSGDPSVARSISVIKFNNIRRGPGGVQLFDVREPNELVDDGSFPDGVNIPLGDIESAFAMDDVSFKAKYGVNKPKPTDKNLVIACKAGRRGLMACEKIEKLGYANCLNLEGGFMAWKEQTKE